MVHPGCWFWVEVLEKLCLWVDLVEMLMEWCVWVDCLMGLCSPLGPGWWQMDLSLFLFLLVLHQRSVEGCPVGGCGLGTVWQLLSAGSLVKVGMWWEV